MSILDNLNPYPETNSFGFTEANDIIEIPEGKESLHSLVQEIWDKIPDIKNYDEFFRNYAPWSMDYFNGDDNKKNELRGTISFVVDAWNEICTGEPSDFGETSEFREYKIDDNKSISYEDFCKAVTGQSVENIYSDVRMMPSSREEFAQDITIRKMDNSDANLELLADTFLWKGETPHYITETGEIIELKSLLLADEDGVLIDAPLFESITNEDGTRELKLTDQGKQEVEYSLKEGKDNMKDIEKDNIEAKETPIDATSIEQNEKDDEQNEKDGKTILLEQTSNLEEVIEEILDDISNEEIGIDSSDEDIEKLNILETDIRALKDEITNTEITDEKLNEFKDKYDSLQERCLEIRKIDFKEKDDKIEKNEIVTQEKSVKDKNYYLEKKNMWHERQDDYVPMRRHTFRYFAEWRETANARKAGVPMKEDGEVPSRTECAAKFIEFFGSNLFETIIIELFHAIEEALELTAIEKHIDKIENEKDVLIQDNAKLEVEVAELEEKKGLETDETKIKELEHQIESKEKQIEENKTSIQEKTRDIESYKDKDLYKQYHRKKLEAEKIEITKEKVSQEKVTVNVDRNNIKENGEPAESLKNFVDTDKSRIKGSVLGVSMEDARIYHPKNRGVESESITVLIPNAKRDSVEAFVGSAKVDLPIPPIRIVEIADGDKVTRCAVDMFGKPLAVTGDKLEGIEAGGEALKGMGLYNPDRKLQDTDVTVSQALEKYYENGHEEQSIIDIQTDNYLEQFEEKLDKESIEIDKALKSIDKIEAVLDSSDDKLTVLREDKTKLEDRKEAIQEYKDATKEDKFNKAVEIEGKNQVGNESVKEHIDDFNGDVKDLIEKKINELEEFKETVDKEGNKELSDELQEKIEGLKDVLGDLESSTGERLEKVAEIMDSVELPDEPMKDVEVSEDTSIETEQVPEEEVKDPDLTEKEIDDNVALDDQENIATDETPPEPVGKEDLTDKIGDDALIVAEAEEMEQEIEEPTKETASEEIVNSIEGKDDTIELKENETHIDRDKIDEITSIIQDMDRADDISAINNAFSSIEDNDERLSYLNNAIENIDIKEESIGQIADNVSSAISEVADLNGTSKEDAFNAVEEILNEKLGEAAAEIIKDDMIKEDYFDSANLNMFSDPSSIEIPSYWNDNDLTVMSIDALEAAANNSASLQNLDNISNFIQEVGNAKGMSQEELADFASGVVEGIANLPDEDKKYIVENAVEDYLSPVTQEDPITNLGIITENGILNQDGEQLSPDVETAQMEVEDRIGETIDNGLSDIDKAFIEQPEIEVKSVEIEEPLNIDIAETVNYPVESEQNNFDIENNTPKDVIEVPQPEEIDYNVDNSEDNPKDFDNAQNDYENSFDDYDYTDSTDVGISGD